MRSKYLLAYSKIIILVLLTVSRCKNITTNENRPLIYKGYVTQIHQYPHAVYLSFELTRPSSCGASLITVQAILTAAHCIDELRYKSGKIIAHLGTTVPKDAKVLRQVVQYETHPKYDSVKGRNNIAVAFLNRRVPLSRYVQKIPIIVKDPLVGADMYSAGWGKQTLPNKIPDLSRFRSLRATKQRIISRKECSKHAGFRVSAGTICTIPMIGHNYKDDAGNGLIAKNPIVLLVGVLSFVANDVSIYTSVLPNRDWIMKSVKGMYEKICLRKRIKVIG